MVSITITLKSAFLRVIIVYTEWMRAGMEHISKKLMQLRKLFYLLVCYEIVKESPANQLLDFAKLVVDWYKSSGYKIIN